MTHRAGVEIVVSGMNFDSTNNGVSSFVRQRIFSPRKDYSIVHSVELYFAVFGLRKEWRKQRPLVAVKVLDF